MIQRDVFGITDKLHEYLSNACENCALKWKKSASTNPDDYVEEKPRVYKFTFEGEEIPESPAILIQTTRITPDNIHYILYMTVCHPAVQECEIVDRVEGTREYAYRTDTVDEKKVPAEGFTSEGVRQELYRACLMLGDYVLTQLERMDNDCINLSNLTLIPPSPYMAEFPYCSTTLEFDVSYISMPKAIVGTTLRELL